MVNFEFEDRSDKKEVNIEDLLKLGSQHSFAIFFYYYPIIIILLKDLSKIYIGPKDHTTAAAVAIVGQ